MMQGLFAQAGQQTSKNNAPFTGSSTDTKEQEKGVFGKILQSLETIKQDFKAQTNTQQLSQESDEVTIAAEDNTASDSNDGSVASPRHGVEDSLHIIVADGEEATTTNVHTPELNTSQNIDQSSEISQIDNMVSVSDSDSEGTKELSVKGNQEFSAHWASESASMLNGRRTLQNIVTQQQQPASESQQPVLQKSNHFATVSHQEVAEAGMLNIKAQSNTVIPLNRDAALALAKEVQQALKGGYPTGVKLEDNKLSLKGSTENQLTEDSVKISSEQASEQKSDGSTMMSGKESDVFRSTESSASNVQLSQSYNSADAALQTKGADDGTTVEKNQQNNVGNTQPEARQPEVKPELIHSNRTENFEQVLSGAKTADDKQEAVHPISKKPSESEIQANEQTVSADEASESAAFSESVKTQEAAALQTKSGAEQSKSESRERAALSTSAENSSATSERIPSFANTDSGSQSDTGNQGFSEQQEELLSQQLKGVEFEIPSNQKEEHMAGLSRLGESVIMHGALRKEILPGLAQIVSRSAQQPAISQKEVWQKHNFEMEDGNSMKLSTRQNDGVMQVKIAVTNVELARLMQQYEQEIKDHLRNECNLDIDLEFSEDSGGDMQQFFDEASAQGNRAKVNRNQMGNLSGDQENISEQLHTKPVRKFGYNQNEWIA